MAIPVLSVQTTVTASAALARGVLLAVLPAGGQRAARRNAWAGMSRDAVQARDRREADAAVSTAQLRAGGYDAAHQLGAVAQR